VVRPRRRGVTTAAPGRRCRRSTNYLYNATTGGALQYPPYSTITRAGEVLSYPPGYKENAGLLHNTPGSTSGGRCWSRRKALEYYLSICPWRRRIDVYRSEPMSTQMTASQFSPRRAKARTPGSPGPARGRSSPPVSTSSACGRLQRSHHRSCIRRSGKALRCSANSARQTQLPPSPVEDRMENRGVKSSARRREKENCRNYPLPARHHRIQKSVPPRAVSPLGTACRRDPCTQRARL